MGGTLADGGHALLEAAVGLAVNLTQANFARDAPAPHPAVLVAALPDGDSRAVAALDARWADPAGATETGGRAVAGEAAPIEGRQGGDGTG